MQTMTGVLACGAAGVLVTSIGGCAVAQNAGASDRHCLVLVELTAQEGKGAELLEVCESMLSGTRAYTGNQVVDLYVDQDNPDVVCWVEYWDSSEAYNTYLQWRMTDGAEPAMGPLLGGPVNIRFLDPTDN